eukprot:GHRQ01039745.1.p1 GENE.GHRQ01039745.1~~GHRQ01039745.1.p1  ORF type:complete len:102 (-),score=41.13 GHRQ01039745.1:80-385(-)
MQVRQHALRGVRMMQELSEWACIYIKYLQTFRKLEAAYDQMLQPQKRQDMRKALEACMGRMLEIRHWLVRASAPTAKGSHCSTSHSSSNTTHSFRQATQPL